jgi:hypothetical protein
MKDLFDPTLAEDIKQRIMRLHPESQRRWGNMTLAQTLGSLSDPPLGGNLFFPPRPDSGGSLRADPESEHEAGPSEPITLRLTPSSTFCAI